MRAALEPLGHRVERVRSQGIAQAILMKEGRPEGGADQKRYPESFAAAE